MRGPYGAVSVRVNDGHTDRIVNRYVSGLQFTKVAPGGHLECSFTLTLPRDLFNDLGPADKCWIYDKRTGATIFEAYLENPTPVDGPDGQSWSIKAMGGMVRASDETRPLIYLDQDLSGWVGSSGGSVIPNVNTGPADDPAGATEATETSPADKGLITGFNTGQAIATDSEARLTYPKIRAIGMQVGALQVQTKSGKTDTGYRTELVYRTPSTVAATALSSSSTISTSQVLNTRASGVSGNFADGTDVVALRLRRSGTPTNIADENTWTYWDQIFVMGRRMDRYGALIDGTDHLPATSVLASQIVEDLLGRLLTFCDPATAQIDVTAFTIDQLTYPDGVKAADVLNDLVGKWETDYLWEIGETGDNGLHRFALRAWPTSPRYVFSVRDGWAQTGSDIDLCNRILVNWTDTAGNPQVTIVTADDLGLTGLGLPVDALIGRVKDADPIDLPDGFGSLANATRIGGQILTDKVNPPKAGTVVVRRPVLDLLTGNRVMPWELEPGYLGRVRETGDTLRITQVSYDDDAVASTLTMGTPVLTPEQRIARLSRALKNVA